MKNKVPLVLQPGFFKNQTEYESEGRWIDGDKVRFRDGRPKKIGGWTRHKIRSVTVPSGVPRDIHAWATLDGTPHAVCGTEQGLFEINNGSWTDITPVNWVNGTTRNVYTRGFGSGRFGGGAFGQGDEDLTGLIPMSSWSIDNYGEDIIACFSRGKIYFWDKSVGGPAVEIAAAPAQTTFMFLNEPTPFVIALGCTDLTDTFNPMFVRWSNGEDYNNWTPSQTSLSGFQLLQGGSRLLGGRSIREGNLIWSDTNCFYMEETGAAVQAFSIRSIASNAGIIAPHAHVEINGEVFWMGTDAFYRYSGANVEQLRTSVDEAVFEDSTPESINRGQKEKTYAGINTQFNEIWWFYPGRNSDENNRYVIFNYAEGSWYTGTLDRTVWVDNEIFTAPLAMDPSGVLYDHETGKNADGQAMYSWIESGDFDLDEGDYLQFCDRFIPDIKDFVGSIDLTLVGKEHPQNPEVVTRGPFTIFAGTRYQDMRLRARTIKIKIESYGVDFDYKWGKSTLRIKQSGRR